MTALQKLPTPAAARVVVERGPSTLGGPVARAGDVEPRCNDDGPPAARALAISGDPAVAQQ